MPHLAVRIVAVVGAAGALWLVAGGAAQAREEMVITTRIPYVPAEVLPPAEVPATPSSAIGVRIDPGDNEAPDPAPRLIITISGS